MHTAVLTGARAQCRACMMSKWSTNFSNWGSVLWDTHVSQRWGFDSSCLTRKHIMIRWGFDSSCLTCKHIIIPSDRDPDPVSYGAHSSTKTGITGRHYISLRLTLVDSCGESLATHHPLLPLSPLVSAALPVVYIACGGSTGPCIRILSSLAVQSVSNPDLASTSSAAEMFNIGFETCNQHHWVW